jgi:hypothetical protein
VQLGLLLLLSAAALAHGEDYSVSIQYLNNQQLTCRAHSSCVLHRASAATTSIRSPSRTGAKSSRRGAQKVRAHAVSDENAITALWQPCALWHAGQTRNTQLQ